MGDIESLDLCGQQHQYHSRVDQEYTKTKKKLKTEKIIQNGKSQKLLEICQNQQNTLRPQVSNPSGSVVSTMFCKQNQQKKNLFFTWQFLTTSQQKCSILRPLLFSTFPQGFRIFNNFGHPTLGSGGKIGLKIYHMKRGHTNTLTQTQTI